MTADTRWKKHSHRLTAAIQTGAVMGEIMANGEEVESWVEVFPVGDDDVPINVHMEGEDNTDVSVCVSLTADQAEAFADAIAESAEAAREVEGHTPEQ